MQREYIYNGSVLVGFVSGGNLSFVHTDHLTTPQVVTNQSQAVVWIADYQPFGKAKLGLFNSISLDSRFPGQYLDSETGLYYNYFRDYDPSIGRYIESDPIGLEGGINTYAYVEGNPLTGTDPLGLTGRGGSNANTAGTKNESCPDERCSDQDKVTVTMNGGCSVGDMVAALRRNSKPTRE